MAKECTKKQRTTLDFPFDVGGIIIWRTAVSFFFFLLFFFFVGLWGMKKVCDGNNTVDGKDSLHDKIRKKELTWWLRPSHFKERKERIT